MTGLTRRWIRLAVMATALATQLIGPIAGRAVAQTEVTDPKDGPGILPWVLSLVIIILVVGVAFMNSKRSHLD